VPYFVLIYDLVDGFAARRTPYRPEHLGLVRAAQVRGELVMAGALGDPPDRALLIFRTDNATAAEAFARDDPYVARGLVTRWEVAPWAVVTDGALPAGG
jgi:uncharacterized protein YciI